MNQIKSHPKYQYTQVLKEESEKKYYILGLIASDGWVSKKSGRCELTLKQDDRGHLECIKNMIVPQKTLRYRQKQKAFRLTIDSTDFVEDVYLYFSGDNKSQTLCFPVNIPSNYVRHFVRGYIDGDGCIDLYRRYKRTNGEQTIVGGTTRLRVLGTKAFLLGFNQCLVSNKITNYELIPQKKGDENVYYISWVGTSAERILDWVYEDAAIYLPRKKAVYIKIKHSDSQQLLKDILNGNCDYNTQMSAFYADKDIVDTSRNT